MTLGTAQPFGLRDAKVSRWAGGALSSSVDLPGINIIRFRAIAESGRSQGDDRILGVSSVEIGGEVDIEAQGISIEALCIMTGATYTDSGTTPNQIKRMVGKVGTSRPYFMIEGQALNHDGGDVHVRLLKCKLEDNAESGFERGQHAGMSLKAVAVGVTAAEAAVCAGSAAVDDWYDLPYNETQTAIS